MRDKIKRIILRHERSVREGHPTVGHAVIIGPTGSGKTSTITNTLKALNSKTLVIKIDANSLSRPGWSGYNIHTALREAIAVHGQGAVERAIVYIDEIDKIAARGEEQYRTHYRGIQQTLLTLMDRGTLQLEKVSPKQEAPEIKTSQITVIFSGAFPEIWERKVGRATIGFGDDPKEEEGDLHQKLINYGMLPELVYRSPYVIKVEPYSRSELAEIVYRHEMYIQMVSVFGLEVDMNELLDFVEKHPAGARAISIYLGKCDLEAQREPRHFAPSP